MVISTTRPDLMLRILDAGEGLALARLDVLGLGDHARVAVDQDLRPGLTSFMP
jgi:hypothetical protein